MKLLSLRKTQLQNKISEAIQLDDQDHLLCLRSKLVHRYGIEALADSENKITDSLEQRPAGVIGHSSPSLEIEQAAVPSEAILINNLSISTDPIKGEENLEISDRHIVSELLLEISAMN